MVYRSRDETDGSDYATPNDNDATTVVHMATATKSPFSFDEETSRLVIREGKNERHVTVPRLPAKVVKIEPNENAPSVSLVLEDTSVHTVTLV